MVVPCTSASSEIAAEPTERLLPASEDVASSVTPCTLTERPVLDGFHDNTPLQNTLAHKITTQQAQQETTQETTIIIENIPYYPAFTGMPLYTKTRFLSMPL